MGAGGTKLPRTSPEQATRRASSHRQRPSSDRERFLRVAHWRAPTRSYPRADAIPVSSTPPSLPSPPGCSRDSPTSPTTPVTLSSSFQNFGLPGVSPSTRIGPQQPPHLSPRPPHPTPAAVFPPTTPSFS